MNHLQQIPPPQPKPQLSPFLRAISALALVLSGVTAILLAPFFAGLTEITIVSLVVSGYGEQFAPIAKVANKLLSALLIFFGCQLAYQSVFLSFIIRGAARLFR